MKVHVLGPAVLAVLALALPAVASTGPALSVKAGGQWYWSADLTDGVFDPRGDPLAGLMQASGGKAMKGLEGLTRDQSNRLSETFYGAKLLAIPRPTSPALGNGIVVFSSGCRPIGTSIPSAYVDLDLYHQFRCTVTGATYKRWAQFEAAITSAKAELMASRAPKPNVLVDALAASYERFGEYQRHGEPVHLTITLTVTGRRAVTGHVVAPS